MPKIQQFSIRGDNRGSLIALECGKEIPFAVRRAYYIFGTSMGVARGYHAHKALSQICIAVAGSCRMILDDGTGRSEVMLDRPDKGLLIRSNIWREMHDFSEDCVLLVLADSIYDESDYIRDYDHFLEFVSKSKLSFHPYDMDYLDHSWNWLNDPETKALVDAGDFTRAQQRAWFESLSGRNDYLVWGVGLHNQPVGVVGLKGIERASAEYFGYFGEKSCWGKGLGQQMLDFAEDQARQRGITLMRLRVLESNTRAIRLYERLGYRFCATQPPASVLMVKALG
jgi:RimJ/RimL family protein N-acetyltransferase